MWCGVAFIPPWAATWIEPWESDHGFGFMWFLLALGITALIELIAIPTVILTLASTRDGFVRGFAAVGQVILTMLSLSLMMGTVTDSEIRPAWRLFWLALFAVNAMSTYWCLAAPSSPPRPSDGPAPPPRPMPAPPGGRLPPPPIQPPLGN